MSFPFGKNGSSSWRRIKDKLRGRDSDEEGLDVIYWSKFFELENSGKISESRKPRRGEKSVGGFRRAGADDEEEDEDDDVDEGFYRGSGSNNNRKGDESIGEAFSFHGKKSQSPSGGEIRSIGGGRSPPLPLPPGHFSAEIASSSTSPLPLAVNQTVPHVPANQTSPPSPPPPSAAAPPPPPSAAAPPPPPSAAAPPPPPPPPNPAKKAPAPPLPLPPGKKAPGPPPPPMSKTGPPKPPGIAKGPAESSSAISKTEDPAQPKLKPFHWDKVKTDRDHSMVWDQIGGGSFNFEGHLMEALFGNIGARKPSESNSVPQKPTVLTSYILAPRKSQNIAIVLKSLGMTKEEIIDLLTEGHDADPDTLEKLSRIAPTAEEQTEIIEFSGDPTKLANAESLLFHILRAVPSAFSRFNVMLFKINYGSEVAQQKGSLQTLESACNELRARGLLLKLLEAILKAGNKMNAGTARGNAQAFNLTALRKLSDVKSVDGKTTLLHFVVEAVVRSKGKRAAMSKVSNDNTGGSIADASREEQEIEFIKLGLPILSGLSSEFTNVKKAAGIDYESFVATTLALGTRVKETKRLLDQSKGKEDGCLTKLRSFFESAEEELRVITEEQMRIMDLVKKTTNYYQAGALKERNLFQLFVIIRDFLGMVDNACSEIARNQRKQRPTATVTGASTSTAATPSAAAPQRNAVRFPVLPPNFMSEHSSNNSRKGDESIGEAFSLHGKKSQSPSDGEIRDQSHSNNSVEGEGGRYYTSSSTSAASPSLPSTSSTGGVSDYVAVGKQSQSKSKAPGGGSFPSSPSQIPPMQSIGGGNGSGGGRSPPLPLPPGQFAAAIASSSTSPLPLAVNQTLPHVPANQTSPPPPPPPSTAAPPPPPPPPIPAKKAPAPPPPPPPGKKAPGPPPPPMPKTGPPTPPGNGKGPAESSSAIGKTEDPAQPKLKPFHWDKVKTDRDHSMVWDQIGGGSFNFEGHLMEALFGNVGARKPSESNSVPQKPTVLTSYILAPRKSQNIAIVLKSLGMTKEEIIDLLTEGHDADPDTLEKLSRIAPTAEEQSEIIEFSGDPTKLANAESLLFHILRAVPFAFNRFNVMLFKINYGSEVVRQKGSLQTLESACNELRARGLFMKLLEAILKAGNKMNAGTARGNAQAFNLISLRKLPDMKSVDGKTNLLHVVVEEVVRSEGKRAAMNKVSNDNTGGSIADASREEQKIEFIKLGLPIIGGLSSEFTNVKKAAGIDYESFVATTLALGTRVKETKRLLDQSKGKEDGCLTKLRSFFESAEEELRVITEEQMRIMDLVKKTTNYYQAGALKERNLFQVFVIIRDFLGMVDNACSEIARNQRKQRPTATVAGASTSTAATPSAAAPQRKAVIYLPPNFMTEHSRYRSDSDSDS